MLVDYFLLDQGCRLIGACLRNVQAKDQSMDQLTSHRTQKKMAMLMVSLMFFFGEHNKLQNVERWSMSWL